MASRAAPPAFLTPSPTALRNVLSILSEREHLRRTLAAEGSSGCKVRIQGRGEPANGATDDDCERWFSVSAGTSRENLAKNRYGDIIAYDRTRCLPPLRTTASSDEANYVNASLVREPDLGFDEKDVPRRWWVAAQAPIPPTVHDFLSLLLTPPSSLAHQSFSPSVPQLPLINLIVQLTPLIEGRRQKCHPYFPANVGETVRIASASGEEGEGVWVRLEEKGEREGARESLVRVGKEGDETGRKVVHLEYLGWRDHGVPEDASHLLRFIQRVHCLNASLSSPSSSTPAPILLHCSAGVGRTGTFIAISSLLPLLSYISRHPSAPLPHPPQDPSHPLGAYPAHRALLEPNSAPREQVVDYVGATIDGLRDQRTTMCQTHEQVGWVWEALREAWREGLY
ncbi:Tyrosine-protein phosphatase 1 [Rhodotorula toruloides]|uniref:BY PROTMAP: gi/472588453/gb/EMS25925.1/ protein tyrosine phosphatase [Rhodosporidium toruloides NP11] gi/647396245/emb/CDR38269.1/ RHTO0S03e07206g1_1 [Rhodosporidium toruloides] n=1 Tax=Rhodotorula toruloides TaxID=5286 RepID=A0A0K3C7A3_RHOTO|nr:Tyrosine-protein phosphatase 1 [Rhodotorula toruloides]PRQ77939.1 Protein-tyrosine phosphatase-like protein [Rhodotorula toruloides]